MKTLTFEVKEYSIDDIIEMAENLKKYCILIGCDGCRFNLPGMDCPLDFSSTGVPYMWEMDDLYRAQKKTREREKE